VDFGYRSFQHEGCIWKVLGTVAKAIWHHTLKFNAFQLVCWFTNSQQCVGTFKLWRDRFRVYNAIFFNFALNTYPLARSHFFICELRDTPLRRYHYLLNIARRNFHVICSNSDPFKLSRVQEQDMRWGMSVNNVK